MILIQIESIPGDSDLNYHQKWIAVENFSFGVEREVSDSGKAGTGDINVGIGEIQEATMSKSYDRSSPLLMEKAVSGFTVNEINVHFVETINGKDQLFLAYKMQNSFIKSWSQSGDADERPTDEFSIFFYAIYVSYWQKETKDGKITGTSTPIDGGWDRIKNAPWRAKIPQLPKK